ncbi:MAG TPA: V-type ATPase 116kDa subunit family protein, partial [Gemmatimonadaceae bacterium]|nr:V-type ATPase 116kDa subunit family protein [Gemmatimonadaceae bacterium]
GRTKRDALAVRAREAALDEERALLNRYRDFLTVVLPAVRKVKGSPRLTSHAVVVPAAARQSLGALGDALRTELGAEFTMTTHPLAGGDVAVLLVLPAEFSRRLEARLAEARVPEVPLPDAFRDLPLDEAVPRMLARLIDIPNELAGLRDQRLALARDRTDPLRRAHACIADWLATAAAHERGHVTAHAFAIDGWVPEPAFAALSAAATSAGGPAVIVEAVAREEWRSEDTPVALSNPRLFQPFEVLLRLLPLPKYGTIDPTPFVAVFFPLMFGMMLGDVGYGVALAVIALVLHRRSAPGSLTRVIAEVAGPCAAFSIVFGVLYGEYFGDAARRLFGVKPLLVDREQAILAMIAAAVALGVVHIVLGLVLGALTALRHSPREALGQGVSALMVVLVVLALLAAFNVLPSRLFTPAVIILLVAFPVLVFAEGMIAPIELLATFGNVLSYARIMAIGTASVMLAVVANQMMGTMGSAVVGFVFALLFHLVNFAIGLFSPAIHTLRLHYVEFFGKFYSPGGTPYHPFRHGDAEAELHLNEVRS